MRDRMLIAISFLVLGIALLLTLDGLYRLAAVPLLVSGLVFGGMAFDKDTNDGN